MGVSAAATRMGAKRRLIVHDSLAFMALLAVTVALFAVTLLLFRSFQARRAELAVRWAERGAAAFAAEQPAAAVVAYRTALAYAPGERSYELRLAGALGAAGRTEEAYAYFVGLWETRPGDGSINLQLARLAARRRDVQGAIDYYRAAVYGTWEGDGLTRRREARLELARYLIAQRQLGAARAELLVAGGNAPDTVEMDVMLAGLLEGAGAATDALGYYRRALVGDPKNLRALRGAGRLAYATGDYRLARTLLGRVVAPDEEDARLRANAERVLELAPDETLPVRERVGRILEDRAIAKARWTACAAGADSVGSRWAGAEGTAGRAALLRDAALQAGAVRLVYDTEVETEHCAAAPAAGDDALLLALARRAREVSDR